MPNDHKTPKIIQLTTPFDRFQKFDRKADQVLKLLDEMGDLYIDLGFRESDIEDYNKEQANQLSQEMIGKLNSLISVTQQNKPIPFSASGLLGDITNHAAAEEKRHGAPPSYMMVNK